MIKGLKFRGLYLRGDIYWLSKLINGKRLVVSLETKDYVEAVKRAKEILDNPELNASAPMREEIEKFLHYKLNSNRFSKDSFESKGYILQRFATFVDDKPLSKITEADCESFYRKIKQNIAPVTAESYMFALRSFFRWCHENNLIRKNPVLGVRLDRIDRKGRRVFVDLEIVDRLINNAPNDDLRFVLYCGFHTGMRKKEIIEARPDWFNLEARTVEIRSTDTFRPKDRDNRTVPLTDQFVSFLHKYGLKSPFVLKPEILHGSHRYRYDFS